MPSMLYISMYTYFWALPIWWQQLEQFSVFIFWTCLRSKSLSTVQMIAPTLLLGPTWKANLCTAAGEDRERQRERTRAGAKIKSDSGKGKGKGACIGTIDRTPTRCALAALRNVYINMQKRSYPHKMRTHMHDKHTNTGMHTLSTHTQTKHSVTHAIKVSPVHIIFALHFGKRTKVCYSMRVSECVFVFVCVPLLACAFRCACACACQVWRQILATPVK